MISTSWEIWQQKWCQRVVSHWKPGMTFLSQCSSIHARSLPTKRPCRCCWEKQQRLFAAREELLGYWPTIMKQFINNSCQIVDRKDHHGKGEKCQCGHWCWQDGLFQFKAYQLSTIFSFPINTVCIVVIKELKWKSCFSVERNDKQLKLRIKSLFFSRRKDQGPAHKGGALRSHLQSTFAEQKNTTF